MMILVASGFALLSPRSVEGSRAEPFKLPAEISDIGYLQVKHGDVAVPVPDIERHFQVGDTFDLVQRNLHYYIAVDDREDQPRRLFAVRRKLRDGRGSAWVTKQKVLIFGNFTGTEPGIFYLQPGELLPILVESRNDYVVLCERYGMVFELRVPKTVKGVQLVQQLPKSLFWHDEEMGYQSAWMQPFRRGGDAPSEMPPPAPPFHAKQSDAQWTGDRTRPPTAPAMEAAAGASLPGAVTLPQPKSPTDSPPSPAVSTPRSVSTSPTPPAGSPPPAAASPPEPASLPALARVPQRIPQSLPIDWIGTSEFIADLGRAMRQGAVSSPSPPNQGPGEL